MEIVNYSQKIMLYYIGLFNLYKDIIKLFIITDNK